MKIDDRIPKVRRKPIIGLPTFVKKNGPRELPNRRHRAQ